ncbi:ATP-dependent DNA helicase RecG [Halanaerobacter jeridensis]|uniref:ATP-dependent DNA helicase RecG n=1 Tax=Halanaerobacter jeridensis TaxID=706427 RepID=A0A939BP27_9FIRM|nr:ATP-dependent DNA helicase RecG [Halanaerobacter jeridensis]MBM7556432.1 ATP-dependent DNA helicase RecG [Halanaerobacter jeridensis]
MNKIKEIFNKLIKPLPIEFKLKGLNTSVFGGFDSYVLKLSQKLKTEADTNETVELIEKLEDLFSDYEDVTLDERYEKLEDAVEIINQLGQKIHRQKIFKLKNNKLEKIEKKKKQSKQSKTKASNNQKIKSEVKEGQKLPEFWQQEVRYVKGVGEYWAERLKKLEIEEVSDLLYYFPRDYNDWSKRSKIANVTAEEEVTVQGKVVNVNQIKPRQGLKIIKVGINDGTGTLYGVWFNQAYRMKYFRDKQGEIFLFSGEVKHNYGRLEINNPHYEELGGEHLHTARIVPVYPTTKGINQKKLRTIINNTLDKYSTEIPEFLPTFVLDKYNFPDLASALQDIHFPDDQQSLKLARKRFAYEELFILQLGLALKKEGVKEETPGTKHSGGQELVAQYFEKLPFDLTSAQEKVWQEIKEDMAASNQMNRLLQGDVGAGKTVVATLALLRAVGSGFQGALMAPTEILAEQHYLGLKEELAPLGIEVGLLVGSLSNSEKEEVVKQMEAGKIDIIIGTHALIQEEINFDHLGLAIVDEQHRFGVRQRATLQEKGDIPDVLVMTATPIPRTLALTVYGDLDVSVIDELPPGRKAVVTEWRTQQARSKIYSFIEEKVEDGQQAYVVCPLVEESESLDVESATEVFLRFKEEIFPDLNLGLLHGQLKSSEKEDVMEEFRKGKIDVLVSTTVIEVGVDVPNATIMVIEDAQRFGLAQLHQLRGRVGRSSYQSYCILVSDPKTDEGKERMKIMARSNDGFEIAEEDLKLRGPGEFFGTRQHGMPDLKVADIIRDQKVLEKAREDAFEVVRSDPQLNNQQHQILKKFLSKSFDYDFELIDIS